MAKIIKIFNLRKLKVTVSIYEIIGRLAIYTYCLIPLRIFLPVKLHQFLIHLPPSVGHFVVTGGFIILVGAGNYKMV